MGGCDARPAPAGTFGSSTRRAGICAARLPVRPHDVAFSDGRLRDFLNEHHVDTLIVSGGETDVCVLSTVLAAVDLGYRIILVENALCSSSDESHDAIMALYRQRFDIQVGVTNLEQILSVWKRE